MNMKEEDKNGLSGYRGSAQRDRFLHALMPENIRIDGRELPELLSFCVRSAELITYFNTKNEATSNWSVFLKNDFSIFLAMLMDNEPQIWENKVRELIRRFYNSKEDSRMAICHQLGEIIVDMVLLLNQWYVEASALSKWSSGNPVVSTLGLAIRSELFCGFQRFKSILETLEQGDFAAIPANWRLKFEALHPDWQKGKTLRAGEKQCPESADFPPDADHIQLAVEEFRQVFQPLHFTMVLLREKAPDWFSDSLEKNDRHEPHVALLLSFLQLFKQAQAQLNEIPRRHLQHYYFERLLQHQKPQTPDQTIVCFSLADHVDSFRLEKNTLLLADVNEQGVESHYATQRDILLSKANIAALRTIYIGRSAMMKAGSSYKLISGIYAAPVANSLDGQGAVFGAREPSWPVFGEEQLDKSIGERQMTDAEIGFALAAPILIMREGSREIELQFKFTPASLSILVDLIEDIAKNTEKRPDHVVSQLFSNAFLIHITAETGWFKITKWQVDSASNWMKNGAIALSLQLFSADPPIADYDPALHGEDFDTSWPVLKILLNPNQNIYLYSFVQPLVVEAIRIQVEVKGLKSLSLQNEAGLLDNAAPFFPFGPVPNRNAYLLLGSAELFRKRLSKLSLNIDWNNLPELPGGFEEYYREYKAGINNQTFQFRLSALSNYAFWPREAAQQQTFPMFSSKGPDQPLESRTTLDGIELSRFQIQPDPNFQVLPEYTNNLSAGYFKLQLHQAPLAFGHADFPRLFSLAMIAQTKSGSLFARGGDAEKELPLPREPFAPMIEKISLDYVANTTLNMRPLESEENDKTAREKVFSLHPFGKLEIFSDGKARAASLFPLLEDDGYLFIGLEQVKPGRPLSLFFHIRESKHKVAYTGLETQWSYLQDDRWEVFAQDEMLSDTTQKFTTTGIVRLMTPMQIDPMAKNTIMPPGLFWVRVAAKGNLNMVGRMLDARMNAVEAVWVDNGDAAHFNPKVPLPPIQGLVQQRPEIAGLVQPIGFSGGKAAEALPEFYVRTSERLRHKNRGVTLWDLEHLVLEQFPELRRVKCIGRIEYPKLHPGQVKIVVIPKAPANDHEPMIGFHQLETIRAFLQEKTSPFVQIQVINPVYEKIKLSCMIRLKKGMEADKGYYVKLLQDELLHFICPWLQGGEIELGGAVRKNEVLEFLKQRPYIHFVTKFSMVQIFEDDAADFQLADTAGAVSATEQLVATTPWSVLSPVEQHNIYFAGSDDHILPEADAIEEMRLGTDFVVLEGAEPEADPATDSAGIKIHPDPPAPEPDDDWYFTPTS